MVFNNELRSDRRATAQRKSGGAVQFFIREFAHRFGRFSAVLMQELQRFGFCYCGLLLCMLCIELGNDLPIMSVTAFPLPTDRATSISMGYIVAT